MPKDVLGALRHYKPDLIEFITSLERCPERSRLACLIERASSGHLCLPEIQVSYYEMITDANRYVLWALAQVQTLGGRRMKVICGLLRVAEVETRYAVNGHIET